MDPIAPISRSDDHLSFLDHIRGLAIILVFGFHALHPAFGRSDLPWDGWFRDFNVPRLFLVLLPVSSGSIGVAIFFVVSGFCIHLSHERSKQKDLRTFFVRRFFRIYPPYFLALAFFALVFPRSRLRLDSPSDFANLGSHALLIHNFFKPWAVGINGSFWSLAVEAQLYLLYPLLLVLVRHSDGAVRYGSLAKSRSRSGAFQSRSSPLRGIWDHIGLCFAHSPPG